MNNEIINVQHCHDEPDDNWKQFSFSWNGFSVEVRIGGVSNFWSGIWVTVFDPDKKDDGIDFRIFKTSKGLCFSISDTHGDNKTTFRSLSEFFKLNKFVNSVFFIRDFLK